MGRPSDYEEGHCETVLGLGKAGMMVAEMAAHFDVSRQTFYAWQDAYPNFLDACHRARTYAQAFWEKEKRKAALYEGELPLYRGKSLEFILSRGFREDWGDKQEVVHSGSVEGFAIEFVNERHPAADEGEG